MPEILFLWPYRNSRQTLRQATVTSRTANAIAVTNTVIIVANERTYRTPWPGPQVGRL